MRNPAGAGRSSRGRAAKALLPAIAVLASLLCPSRGNAQDVGRFEFGLFGGGYFGSRIFLNDAIEVRIGRTPSYGFRLGYHLNKDLSLDAAMSRTSGRLIVESAATGEPLTPESGIDVNSYELDLLYGFGHGWARGYFGVGAGAMTLHPFVPGVRAPADTRFAGNVALGGKFYLGERVALRVDGRYRIRTTGASRLGAIVCGEGEGCFGTTTNLYSSGELSAGLSVRIGGAVPDPPTSRPVTIEPSTGTAVPTPSKHFWTAAAEVFLLEVLPWGFDRYVLEEPYAYISFDTVQANFRSGFTYDHDSFEINQANHPFHGSLFYNAARSNGFTFWESGAFALTGSFLWECCMENSPPSINDLINTTLGGMSRGEMSHRLAVMLRDNTQTGSNRFWREVGGTLLDPVSGLTRLLHGEWSKVYPNPEERFPSGFNVSGDLAYRHVSSEREFDEGILWVNAVYGDPFAGEYLEPFDSFWVAADIGQKRVARIEGRGVLVARELTDASARARHILAANLEYTYFNNEAQVFGAQILSAGLSSRYTLGNEFAAGTDLLALGMPLAGVRTIAVDDPELGPSYDYGPGYGVRAAVGLYRHGWEVASASYGAAWTVTADGFSDSNTLQFFRASARLPITKAIGIGGGYSWYSRKTFYPGGFVEPRAEQKEWRVFASWSLFPNGV